MPTTRCKYHICYSRWQHYMCAVRQWIYEGYFIYLWWHGCKWTLMRHWHIHDRRCDCHHPFGKVDVGSMIIMCSHCSDERYICSNDIASSAATESMPKEIHNLRTSLRRLHMWQTNRNYIIAENLQVQWSQTYIQYWQFFLTNNDINWFIGQ